MAVNEAFRLAFASLCLDRAWNLMKFGIAIAARMPMIATTIISSISVKPFCSFLIIWSSVVGTDCGTVEQGAGQSTKVNDFKWLNCRRQGAGDMLCTSGDKICHSRPEP